MIVQAFILQNITYNINVYKYYCSQYHLHLLLRNSIINIDDKEFADETGGHIKPNQLFKSLLTTQFEYSSQISSSNPPFQISSSITYQIKFKQLSHKSQLDAANPEVLRWLLKCHPIQWSHIVEMESAFEQIGNGPGSNSRDLKLLLKGKKINWTYFLSNPQLCRGLYRRVLRWTSGKASSSSSKVAREKVYEMLTDIALLKGLSNVQ
ncbi:Hypothetical_protein [Hexamita inflata]|uniref:Hypothetical_protein n=1 Tax=Hexamita inflata TaxID=28002 RepID=A0AA86QIU9_9EUKA|nr:Hypothetical protein HINF_LOCUS41649 [Hexamita inflata]